MSTVLVVDDEAGIRELLREILEDEGFQVRLAENAAEARALRQQAKPDLVLLDIWMPDTDGITLLKEWVAQGQLTMPVVMMSGHGTIETAVEATRIGAVDFLEKPIALQKLLKTVSDALKKGEALPAAPSLGHLAPARSRVIVELRQRLAQLGNLKAPLLLLESLGAGAEMCARFLLRPNTPWVAPEGTAWLVDHPLDALTRARDGVLFIGQIDHLGRLEQRGLSLVLARLEKYDTRLICSADTRLPALAASGEFDPALFQSLGGLTLAIPALHEYREDIPDIARTFLNQLVESRQVPQRKLTMAALNALRTAEWPGNLAQLENTVRTLALTALEEEIGLPDVQRVLAQTMPQPGAAAPGLGPLLDLPLREARDAFERSYFEHQISRLGGNMSRVAETVEMERTHLYRKLKQLGIPVGRKSGGQ